jgi:hypothetical protein
LGVTGVIVISGFFLLMKDANKRAATTSKLSDLFIIFLFKASES